MSAAAPLEVVTLGAGNYCATRRYYTSLLLIGGGERVLVDCPEPIFRICAEAARRSGREVDPAKIDRIIISHIHGDHCNGLESLGFWRRFTLGESRRPTIHTSRAAADSLRRKLAVSMTEATLPPKGEEARYRIEDYYEFDEIENGGVIRIGEMEIATHPTIHSVPCFGIRATCGGRTFGYSCDTSYSKELIDFLAPSDLIFHECGDGMHTPLASLEALPEAIRKKMRLIHVADDFAGSEKIELAEEGRVYRV